MSQDKSEMFLYYWRMIAPKMPLPVAEYRFDECLGRKHRFDWAWVAERVAVEVDGGSHAPGGGRHATDKDRDKLNLAASLRWFVFRFSPEQITRDPDECVRLVMQAIIDSQ